MGTSHPQQISARRMRIAKYRGTRHATDEYPFLIGNNGLPVLPLSSLSLQHTVSTERVSTGVPYFGEMFGGEGFCKGTTWLVSGTAGSGKTTLSAHFAPAAHKRGERCLYLGFGVRKLPEPLRKIIGDLSDMQRVLVGLHIAELEERFSAKAAKA
jgi:KaiC